MINVHDGPGLTQAHTNKLHMHEQCVPGSSFYEKLGWGPRLHPYHAKAACMISIPYMYMYMF